MNIIESLRDVALLVGDDTYENVCVSVTLKHIAALLEQSGALVPVPYGEPCERRKCCIEHFLYADKVYHDLTDGKPTDITTGSRYDISWNAIVQPIRLVPITEAEL